MYLMKSSIVDIYVSLKEEKYKKDAGNCMTVYHLILASHPVHWKIKEKENLARSAAANIRSMISQNRYAKRNQMANHMNFSLNKV